jgi:hypothetical protein
MIKVGFKDHSPLAIPTKKFLENMPSYPLRTLGDEKVSAQGLGCMGMSQAYPSFGGYNDDESLATLTEAANLGITFVS